jgi:N-glycosylase/DNA lyase
MAELVGGLAAGLQIAEGLLKLQKELSLCVKTIHDAPKEIDAFSTETLIFSNCLTEFHSIASELFGHLDSQYAEARSPEMKDMTQTISAIVKQCRLAKRGVKTLLKRVKRIGDKSVIMGFIARVKWYLQQGPVKILQCVLNNVKLNVMMATHILWCRVLMDKVKTMERENKEISVEFTRKM